jgi:hypothetical protein
MEEVPYAMSRGPSPLVGYNTNVRHKGKLYHIQTEDSGVNHPHIITHLFADGGRIIASKKTDYAQYVGSETLPVIVKKLMQEQHKAMFIALRDCVYDEEPAQAPAPREKKISSEVEVKQPELDLDALERAAEAKIAESAAARAQGDTRKRGAGRYHQTVPAQPKAQRKSKAPSAPPASLFGGSVARSKSLDEVILSYLADDGSDEK